MTSWGRRQKKVIFIFFFRNHENSQAKNPVNGKQKFLKKCLFWRFFEKSDRTNFFFGNGLIEPKNWWKAPYRIVDIPYKTQKRHFSTETVIFGQKKAPAASRQPRKMVLFLEKRYLGQKKSACGKPPAKMPTFFAEKTAKNTKIVTKWSFMGRNGTSTLPKWSEKQDLQESDRVIAPKPLKWGFKSDLMAANFSKIFAIFGPMDTK